MALEGELSLAHSSSPFKLLFGNIVQPMAKKIGLLFSDIVAPDNRIVVDVN
jgi:hypothetical protein